ncbi:hypothetical protein [sulfur-oxidizing endosymbiont of Gigantopelta aegis]|uniref:hypothetical protein n=1 Tax=sulfur-oxidizing endosymbiont of Gigantopelta aegis TaxID=2794934 RepID=UPI001FE4A855|nr:hypothetical protein [sulfur-oxidizing endosymbiont of Gigantopelta aegis]
MSDDAGQFDILLHALCWIHADRVFQRILPLNERHDKELNWYILRFGNYFMISNNINLSQMIR